jgi:hypothetical protein
MNIFFKWIEEEAEPVYYARYENWAGPVPRIGEAVVVTSDGPKPPSPYEKRASSWDSHIGAFVVISIEHKQIRGEPIAIVITGASPEVARRFLGMPEIPPSP